MARTLRPPFVVGLEGTELQLGTAEAGFVEVWCHLRGVAVHGALRELGENAIETAHALIGRILEHPGSQHEHPLLGRNIPMIWEIRGGQRLNVVPDRCSFHLDWRVTPGGPSAASLLAWLEEATADAGGEVELVEVIEPFETDPGAEVVTALGDAVEAATGARPGPTGMVAWTDAHNFVDLGGSQAVVFGPGHLRNAHREDEWVDIDDDRPVRPVARGADRGRPWLAPGGTAVTEPYDVAIIGGGHNGLVAAFYLARARTADGGAGARDPSWAGRASPRSSRPGSARRPARTCCRCCATRSGATCVCASAASSSTRRARR